MKCVEYNNIKFYIGQNAQENFDLLDSSKMINSEYIWFHLNSFPSSYVIMYSTLDEIKNLSENNIDDFLNFGANLCKENSKYKYLKNLKIIYTSLKRLTKTDKIGEVIISGKKNILSI
jgi:predicted ribosome quality control (RQC) complex YloA/Tae2 family protein